MFRAFGDAAQCKAPLSPAVNQSASLFTSAEKAKSAGPSRRVQTARSTNRDQARRKQRDCNNYACSAAALRLERKPSCLHPPHFV